MGLKLNTLHRGGRFSGNPYETYMKVSIFQSIGNPI